MKLIKKTDMALNITFKYLLISFIWILFSDKVLMFFSHNSKQLFLLGIIKGYFFIIATSVLLYTMIKKDQKKIEHMAYYDYLTNLPNRKLFMNKLQIQINHCIKHNKSGAVLFLDLDDFKMINDTLGHNYGDLLLKIVSRNLKKCVRKIDIVARFGGDEFLILLPNINNISEIKTICEKILNMFNDVMFLNNKQIHTGASIGIFQFTSKDNDINTIIKNVDTAMYKAKSLGKNQYFFFDDTLSYNIERKNKIEEGLRTAIENHELSILYQPQIDINTGTLKGVEALLRWNHKELGMISPSEFIPIAEETGVINKITEWVLLNSCSQYNEWIKSGYNIKFICVNISSVQFKNELILDMIENTIKQTKINPSSLHLEITESILIHNLENAISILHKLRALEVRIDLDDFGTGYSSLSYLKNLPIDTLKIDKSFIDDIHTNTESKNIIKGIIQLAETMNLNIIAEGVENKEQIKLLKKLNCNTVQGYYFSKPISPAEIHMFKSNN